MCICNKRGQKVIGKEMVSVWVSDWPETGAASQGKGSEREGPAPGVVPRREERAGGLGVRGGRPSPKGPAGVRYAAGALCSASTPPFHVSSSITLN